jgi:membrane dipeptidase
VATSAKPEDASPDAGRTYAGALVWDNHSGFDPQPYADLENLQIWRNAGVDYLSVNVGYDVMEPADTLRTLAAYRHWLKARPDRFLLAELPADAWRAKRDGRLAVTFDIEGMNVLGGNLDMVEVLHDLGVRQMLFAYNRNNLAGAGCHGEDVGLTPFGRDVVREMNRVGMIVDCTHSGYRTTMEAMELSADPVVFSHSNAWALAPHGRNIRDDQVRACAATGGVVCVTGVGRFLGGSTATSTFVDHVAHVADLVGPAHVGISLDYAFEVEGIEDLVASHPEVWPPEEYPPGSGGPHDFMPPGRLPAITAELLARGFSDLEVRGVLGENMHRLASRVWRTGR